MIQGRHIVLLITMVRSKVIKNWLREHKEIKSYVDFGAGDGYYGYYIKSYINPKAKLIAVEIWKPDRKRLKENYDEVIIGDIMKVEFPEAECAIFGDILEHLEKEEALTIIKKASNFYKHIIVKIPADYRKQGQSKGNPFQIHKSLWDYSELEKIFEGYPVRKKEIMEIVGIFIK